MLCVLGHIGYAVLGTTGLVILVILVPCSLKVARKRKKQGIFVFSLKVLQAINIHNNFHSKP